MLTRFKENLRPNKRRGVIALLAAVFLVMIFAFTAFTVDVGYISIIDQELQGAVDAAALAAAFELKQSDTTEPVYGAAEDLAAANQVNGQSLEVDRGNDVEIGFWDELTGTFTPMPGESDLSLTNAVRVNGTLSQNRDSEVNLFFAPILGHSDVEMTSSAIAVIGRDRPRDVMLVIDRSGSMDDYNRMVYTKAAALQLINELDELESVPSGDETQGDRLGLAIYSVEKTEYYTQTYWRRGRRRTRTRSRTTWEGELAKPLSWDFDPTESHIPTLDPDGRTNIGGGMRAGLEELIANKRYDILGDDVQQILVLMTDGRANESEEPGTTPVNSIYHYAEVARQNDIIIHGITLGSGAEKDPIRYCADHTGGEYHHVEDGDFEGLFEIYRGIGRGSDQPRLVR
ncbi:MAG: vWA domain-containing protein [Planctomycetota bacterium]|jgi:Mg-chelatase subunit ChlD